MQIIIESNARGEGMMDILQLAESYGWVDPEYLPWSPENADATEEDAIDYLADKGIIIHYDEA